ncbi:uncharacterized protein LOC132562864 [Ylistrum balloti]|uniref:uncharacterized protein LOC132562864 n=1 Tax=Ylistrum balloti TaxID=509963 RepID=UPI002905C0CD|nr:uncharacterized protein LOC132562864 [Ylistrum balloti]
METQCDSQCVTLVIYEVEETQPPVFDEDEETQAPEHFVREKPETTKHFDSKKSEEKTPDIVSTFETEKSDLGTKQQNGDYCKLDIGNDCFVVANKFCGKTLIHIRMYDTSERGKLYPTKKGIALDPNHWIKLSSWYYKDVDEAIKKYNGGEHVDEMIHLGRNNYVSLKTGYARVNIRRWFMPDLDKSELKATRAGVALTFEQWERLKLTMLVMPDFIGDILDNTELCVMRGDHQNQEGMMQCFDCNPNQILH